MSKKNEIEKLWDSTKFINQKITDEDLAEIDYDAEDFEKENADDEELEKKQLKEPTTLNNIYRKLAVHRNIELSYVIPINANISPFAWFLALCVLDRECFNFEKLLDNEFYRYAYSQNSVSAITAMQNSLDNFFNSMVAITNRKITLGNVHILMRKIIKAFPKKSSKENYWNEFIKYRYYKFRTFQETADVFNVSIRTIIRQDVFVKEFIDKYFSKTLTTEKMLKFFGQELWFFAFANYVEAITSSGHTLSYKPLPLKMFSLYKDRWKCRFGEVAQKTITTEDKKNKPKSAPKKKGRSKKKEKEK